MNKTLRRFAAIISGIALTLTCLTTWAADNPRVLMRTSMGDITLELYPQQAPKSVANFLQYVKEGHYNDTIFHRVIDNFMVQGGGFDKNMHQKPTRAPIENEAKNGLSNAPYTLAMARTPDPHSATAQFFINVKHNIFLDYPGQDGWGYAVFGKVVKGMHIVDKIKQVPTGRMNVPVQQVVIESVTLVK
ncbi:MAG: peptidyl-prolyl cis-trans isomerase [Oxalobacter sp.]|nr:MAG: peptidyl-prolyl cis-trans isomerase [Oxalobacter sp.]